MTITHLNTFFEADKDYLGFYGYDIFEFNSEEIIFQKLLESNILSDENKLGEFGPFTINKLTENDFTKVAFIELNKLLEKYYEDTNWGNDLEVFKTNVIKVFENIKIENYEINYINLENVRDELKPEYNFWSYFVAIICINRKENKVVKIYFGGD